MADLRVREATASDTEAIADLVNRAYLVERFFVDGDRTSPAEVAHLLDKGMFLLAETDGRLVACVYVELRGERGYFGMLSVDLRVRARAWAAGSSPRRRTVAAARAAA